MVESKGERTLGDRGEVEEDIFEVSGTCRKGLLIGLTGSLVGGYTPSTPTQDSLGPSSHAPGLSLQIVVLRRLVRAGRVPGKSP